MKPAERQSLVALYEQRLAQFGHDVRTVGWGTRESQLLRFRILCDIADLSGCSVCDVGCGFADLLPYLRTRFTHVDYAGIDIAPGFVEQARQRFPDATFHCADLVKDPFDRTFDYLLLSGALSYRIEDNMAYTRAMMAQMFRLARKGVGLNFLSTYVNFQRPLNFHYSPEALFAEARKLTRWVTLRHDYPLWEFTLYLYKQPTAV